VRRPNRPAPRAGRGRTRRETRGGEQGSSPEAPQRGSWPAERWWIDRRAAILAATVALAVAVRIIYFVQLAGSPCIDLHRAPETDMAFFDAWGRAIAAGDLLSARVEPPVHDWHRTLADQYFRAAPADAAAMASEAARLGIEPAAVLWRRWVGGGRFYQEPLYPYLIGAVYAVAGPDPRAVIALQMALGVVSTVFVLLLARRSFGHRAGAAAALLACLGGPWVYPEGVLVRTSLLAFAGLGLALLADRALRAPPADGDEIGRPGARWLVLGLAFGVALLLQTTFLILALGVAIVTIVRERSRAAGALGAFALGIVLGIAPLVARNVAVGVPAFGFASAAPVNVIVGNAYEPGVDATTFRGIHLTEIMAGSRGALVPAVARTLGTYPSPVEFVASVARKAAALAHWYEAPDNTNFYYFRLHAGVMRFLFINLVVVGALGVLGLMRAARRGSEDRLALSLLVVTNLLVVLSFVVRDRFRAPLALALVPFAGFALVEIVDAVRARHVRRAAALLVPALLVAGFIARPLPGAMRTIRPPDYWMPYEVRYLPDAREAGEEHGDWRRAADILERSLRTEPRWLDGLGPSRRARDADDAETARIFADAREGYAAALERAGDAAEAGRERARAAELRAAAERL